MLMLLLLLDLVQQLPVVLVLERRTLVLNDSMLLFQVEVYLKFVLMQHWHFESLHQFENVNKRSNDVDHH